MRCTVKCSPRALVESRKTDSGGSGRQVSWYSCCFCLLTSGACSPADTPRGAMRCDFSRHGPPTPALLAPSAVRRRHGRRRCRRALPVLVVLVVLLLSRAMAFLCVDAVVAGVVDVVRQDPALLATGQGEVSLCGAHLRGAQGLSSCVGMDLSEESSALPLFLGLVGCRRACVVGRCWSHAVGAQELDLLLDGQVWLVGKTLQQVSLGCGGG